MCFPFFPAHYLSRTKGKEKTKRKTIISNYVDHYLSSFSVTLKRREETEIDKTIIYNGGKMKEKYSDIEKAIILPNVREIRVEAFMNAKILKSVVIPDSVGMPISYIRL